MDQDKEAMMLSKMGANWSAIGVFGIPYILVITAIIDDPRVGSDCSDWSEIFWSYVLLTMLTLTAFANIQVIRYTSDFVRSKDRLEWLYDRVILVLFPSFRHQNNKIIGGRYEDG